MFYNLIGASDSLASDMESGWVSYQTFSAPPSQTRWPPRVDGSRYETKSGLGSTC